MALPPSCSRALASLSELTKAIRDAFAPQRIQHLGYTGEEWKLAEMRALHPPHMRSDARNLPKRQFEVFENVAGAGTAKSGNIVWRNRPEIKVAGDVVHHPQEPREAVDQCAIQVEDRERIAGLRYVACDRAGHSFFDLARL